MKIGSAAVTVLRAGRPGRLAWWDILSQSLGTRNGSSRYLHVVRAAQASAQARRTRLVVPGG